MLLYKVLWEPPHNLCVTIIGNCISHLLLVEYKFRGFIVQRLHAKTDCVPAVQLDGPISKDPSKVSGKCVLSFRETKAPRGGCLLSQPIPGFIAFRWQTDFQRGKWPRHAWVSGFNPTEHMLHNQGVLKLSHHVQLHLCFFGYSNKGEMSCFFVFFTTAFTVYAVLWRMQPLNWDTVTVSPWLNFPFFLQSFPPSERSICP